MLKLHFNYVLRFLDKNTVDILENVSYTSVLDVEPDFLSFNTKEEVLKYLKDNNLKLLKVEI